MKISQIRGNITPNLRRKLKIPALTVRNYPKANSDVPRIIHRKSSEDFNALITPCSSSEILPENNVALNLTLERYFNGDQQDESPVRYRWCTPDLKHEGFFREQFRKYTDRRGYSQDFQAFVPVRTDTPNIDKRSSYRSNHRQYPKVMQKFEKPKKVTRLPRISPAKEFDDFFVSVVGSRTHNRPINIIKKFR